MSVHDLHPGILSVVIDEYLRQIHELVAPAVFIDEAAGALTKAERQKDIAVGRAAPLLPRS